MTLPAIRIASGVLLVGCATVAVAYAADRSLERRETAAARPGRVAIDPLAREADSLPGTYCPLPDRTTRERIAGNRVRDLERLAAGTEALDPLFGQTPLARSDSVANCRGMTPAALTGEESPFR